MSKRKEVLKKIEESERRNKSKNQSNPVLPLARLIAVSKKQPLEKIIDIYKEGQRDFGENYVQEFLEKREKLSNLGFKDILWHFIGPLQTNKVDKVVGNVELIHSVGSLRLAERISKKAQEKRVRQKVLLQVNIASEESKSGFSPEDLKREFKDLTRLEGIKLCGLMTMPPFTEKAEDSRPIFKELFRVCRGFRDEFQLEHFLELSMGTTQDYEIALEEGATIIRLGEILFGKREY